MSEIEEKVTEETSTLEQNSEVEENPPAEVASPKPKQRFFVDGSLFTFLLIFGVALLSGIFIFQIWLTPIKVVGTSMQPTLNNYVVSENDENHCDVVYFKKENSYDNNDIVIVANPNEKYVANSEVNFLIKRVIACPGQTIKFTLTRLDKGLLEESKIDDVYYYDISVYHKDGKDINLDQFYIDEEMHFSYTEQIASGSATIDGKPNPYYFPFLNKILSGIANNGYFEYNVLDEQYFIMGDNRNASEDSRFFGAVDYDDVAGAVKFIVPYGKNMFQAIIIKFKTKVY